MEYSFPYQRHFGGEGPIQNHQPRSRLWPYRESVGSEMPLLTGKTKFFNEVGEGDNIDVDDRGFSRRENRVNRCPLAEDGDVTKEGERLLKRRSTPAIIMRMLFQPLAPNSCGCDRGELQVNRRSLADGTGLLSVTSKTRPILSKNAPNGNRGFQQSNCPGFVRLSRIEPQRKSSQTMFAWGGGG